MHLPQEQCTKWYTPVMRIEHQAEITAPPEAVWRLTTDIERWPDLLDAMTSLRRLDEGPLRVGSSARIKQPGQPERTWTVTELAAPNRFVWETHGLGMRMVATHDIAATASGCRNTLGIELSGPVGSVMGRLVGKRIGETIAAESTVFTAEAERAARVLAENVRRVYGLEPGARALLSAPLYHSAPNTFAVGAAIDEGTELVLEERFDAERGGFGQWRRQAEGFVPGDGRRHDLGDERGRGGGVQGPSGAGAGGPASHGPMARRDGSAG